MATAYNESGGPDKDEILAWTRMNIKSIHRTIANITSITSHITVSEEPSSRSDADITTFSEPIRTRRYAKVADPSPAASSQELPIVMLTRETITGTSEIISLEVQARRASL